MHNSLALKWNDRESERISRALVALDYYQAKCVREEFHNTDLAREFYFSEIWLCVCRIQNI